jgi:hypothetical protein
MQDVTFSWKGAEYKVEAREVLPLIAKVEEIITLGELADASNTGKVPLAKLSKAFGVALRYAGAKVTDEEMYVGMFENASAGMAAARSAIMALIGMMIPPEYLQERRESKKKVRELPTDVSAKKLSKRA